MVKYWISGHIANKESSDLNSSLTDSRASIVGFAIATTSEKEGSLSLGVLSDKISGKWYEEGEKELRELSKVTQGENVYGLSVRSKTYYLVKVF